MPSYTEDHLCEQPATELFRSLEWTHICAEDEVLGPASTIGRETTGETVLLPRLRAALQKLNPKLPPQALAAAIEELTRDRSAMSLAAANRDIYHLLKEGVKVSIPNPDQPGQKEERVRVIDWEAPGENEFLLVNQMTVTGDLYSCRPDLIAFVNGLPLVVVELKKPTVSARAAFDDNLTHYKAQIPQLFWYNALMIASNGTESRVGSITADWERFFEWKRVEREEEPRQVSLETIIRGTCERSRLLDIVENFTLFSEEKAGLLKIIGQNHQFLGVNNVIASMRNAREKGHGRGGVFWQTQGAGKSYSMIFFAQKVLRKLQGNWTFVIVTDRTELDNQIARTFKACGAVSQSEGDECHATNGAHLRELIRGNHRYVFTLIHKFQTPEVLSEKRDLIVLTDEAHRSQYDTLALNMRSAMPNAIFLAFTGTPLIAGEERTRDVFGDYVSVYDFQQSVEDGATVPLYYENRTPELRLQNPDLNDEMYDLIEQAELDEEQEKKLDRELGRQYHLITRDERLDTVAKDIVRHFLGRGFQGKAMVISIDKATALRMYDKVQKHWTAERQRVENEIAFHAKLPPVGRDARRGEASERRPVPPSQSPTEEEVAELHRRLDILTSTDMAVIVSPGQNEIDHMQRFGVDIVPHRKRMNEEQLDEDFKDPKNPLRIAFVCAMWLTGFDAQSCSTIYLDKPMRNHSLMQAIARANRVYPGKHSGLIVDYCNVFASLERALAIYGAGKGGATPVRDKQELIDGLRESIVAALAFLKSNQVDLDAIIQCQGMQRLNMFADALEKLISPDPLRKDFLAHERLLATLYNAIKPDPAVVEFTARVGAIILIGDMIRLRLSDGKRPNISAVLADISSLLDRSIAADGFVIRESAEGGAPIIDISKIDFEALAKRFAKSKHKNVEIEQLKAAIRAQLEKLIRLNKTRTDYAEKFEELIESYNAGSRNIDELMQELIKLSRSLNEEQNRHVRENLAEEELTVFDILTRPGPDLSPDERDEVKKVARQLLNRIKALLVLNWRQRTQSRAQVRLAIEDILDTGLPRAYTPELYQRKCSDLFEHIYESYLGEGASVYGQTLAQL